MASKRIKKKIILVNRDFQLRYASAAALVGAVSTMVTAFVILMPLYYFGILRWGVLPPLPILATMAIAIAMNIVLITFFGIYLTHRIAGPMYSLVREMRRIEMGQWGKLLQTRDSDDIQFVVRNFNEMIQGLVKVTREDIARIDALGGVKAEGMREALDEYRLRLETRLTSESSGGRMEYTGDSK